MDRISVNSSNLASIGYDVTSQTLEVEFNHGGIYQYHGVPSTLYDDLMNAESKGTCFDQKIKKAGFKYDKVA